MSAHGHSTDDAHSHDGHAEGDFAHPMPMGMLFSVFFALVFLTVVTVAQSNYNLGSFDIAVVMFIATIKALLVGLFFMHLAFDKPFNLIVFLSSFVFVGLFVVITLSDAKMTAPSFENITDEPPVASAEL
ncbi:cytochrome C oxidase subunit IV family protein [Rhodopirellula sp. JC740]|uniref:Cytochrome C oxidase subunit IV family protein n=1 Tax=Rhodopirellula halodulae TaxID=2894198 RepID=A0ABS8NFB6_9BACT|nr:MULTISPECIES: cytochrome C oxidase subunit IV family protein [unclassified Rhodopirellula]MCC9642228.1 cytochrome C oxidase subunit IV family protein [Rhodopirellula sp. JC740]MCC9655800.1 cytochrome C oxidase subunit IV family protein [Rhodopirellula sp. JC737]